MSSSPLRPFPTASRDPAPRSLPPHHHPPTHLAPLYPSILTHRGGTHSAASTEERGRAQVQEKGGRGEGRRRGGGTEELYGALSVDLRPLMPPRQRSIPGLNHKP
eukprot:945431-Rhodomonas_salina.1